ncbi:hypothetical protein FQN57_003984 [Myotisia sp. PD_48]|nr:hypothetical protein FQN57_003984 [Myotisia sp. PD_48]
MDAFQEYLVPTLLQLNKYIPPSILQDINAYSDFARSHWEAAQATYIEPYIIAPITSMLNAPPDLTSIFLLFLILVLSLKILDYARRVITFWIILVFRLAFWSMILGGGWHVYTVGWIKASQDAAWVVGLLVGFIQRLIAEQAEASRKQSSGRYTDTYGNRGGSR